jgi:hypothetical protein
MDLHRTRRTIVPITFLAAALSLVGCSHHTGSKPSAHGPATLPASAEPVAALKDLTFLAGRWVGVAPRANLVNEEHWMLPRGNAMIGTFRQVRRDGKTAFVEVSQIEATDTGVILRLRHLHSKLDIPDDDRDVSVYTLKSVSKNRVEFAGTESSKGIIALIYTLSPDGQTLTQDIVYDPANTKEKSFQSVYRRERK